MTFETSQKRKLMKFERESINLHDTKLFGVLRPEVIPDGVFFSYATAHDIPNAVPTESQGQVH